MKENFKVSKISNMILELRGHKVIIDRDLALLYGISTKRLNEAVKRNIERFPSDFMFRLSGHETDKVVANCDQLKDLKYSHQLPYAFTRNGANMVSAILHTPSAIHRSIQIMRVFSTLETVIGSRQKSVTQSPKILRELSVHSKAIMHLFRDGKLKEKKIACIEEIQRKMSNLLQQMIIASLGDD